MALKLIPGEAGLDHEGQGREAWALVAGGMREALTVPGLCDEDCECLTSMLSHAGRLAGRNPFTAIGGEA
jgi:hypothetical protein